MLREITSKYDGTCYVCDKSINQGDKVIWNGNGKVCCMDHSPFVQQTGSVKPGPGHVILVSNHGEIQVFAANDKQFVSVFNMFAVEQVEYAATTRKTKVVSPKTIADEPDKGLSELFAALQEDR
jgi:hypothetical protein